MGEMRLITGNSNPALAQAIASSLKAKLVPCEMGRFADGEISVSIGESLRGKHVFIIQSICKSVLDGREISLNDNLVELLILLDCARRDNAEAKRARSYDADDTATGVTAASAFA